VTNRAKAKGSKAEKAVSDYLLAAGFTIAARIPAGATLDVGDLLLPADVPCTVDVKDHATPKLAEWVDRAVEQADNAHRPAGFVWHKRRGHTNPGRWYVTTSGDMFTAYTLRLLGIQ
jgi:hypothetical protein